MMWSTLSVSIFPRPSGVGLETRPPHLHSKDGLHSLRGISLSGYLGPECPSFFGGSILTLLVKQIPKGRTSTIQVADIN